MTKIIISHPMNGRTDDEILAVRDRIAAELTKDGYEVVDTLINETPHFDDNVNLPVYYLGTALRKMSECDSVYVTSGWEYARGCVIEHEVARIYGLELIHEK